MGGKRLRRAKILNKLKNALLKLLLLSNPTVPYNFNYVLSNAQIIYDQVSQSGNRSGYAKGKLVFKLNGAFKHSFPKLES